MDHDPERQPLLPTAREKRGRWVRWLKYVFCLLIPLSLHVLFPFLMSWLLAYNKGLVSVTLGVAVHFRTLVDPLGRLLLDFIARDIDSYIRDKALENDLKPEEELTVDKSESPVKCLKIVVVKGLPTLYTMTYALCLTGMFWVWAVLAIIVLLIVSLALRIVICKGFESPRSVCESRDARDLAFTTRDESYRPKQDAYARGSISLAKGNWVRQTFWVIALLGLLTLVDILQPPVELSSLPVLVKATRDASSLDKSMDKFGKQWFATKKVLRAEWIVPSSVRETRWWDCMARWLGLKQEKEPEKVRILTVIWTEENFRAGSDDSSEPGATRRPPTKGTRLVGTSISSAAHYDGLILEGTER